jgi:predicted nucleic-acid-binding protein
MRAADTNVIVRLLARDDARQLAAAETQVARGLWVSHIVLLETAWVLTAAYGLARDDIADAIDMLLVNANLTIQDSDAVAAAAAQYRAHRSVELADCLILAVARKAGHLPLATFDRNLAKLEGAELLK